MTKLTNKHRGSLSDLANILVRLHDFLDTACQRIRLDALELPTHDDEWGKTSDTQHLNAGYVQADLSSAVNAL